MRSSRWNSRLHRRREQPPHLCQHPSEGEDYTASPAAQSRVYCGLASTLGHPIYALFTGIDVTVSIALEIST